MLTLAKLKTMVEVAKGKKVPTPKTLMESDHFIVAKKTLTNDMELIVYQNGYVLYRVGQHRTVFPLHACGSYQYDSRTSYPSQMQASVFEEESWYFRLILEGEDRIEKNEVGRYRKRTVSYSGVSEEWKYLVLENTMLKDMIEKQEMEELLKMMTKKQRYVVSKYYIDQDNQLEIAKELGVSQQAVNDILKRIKKRLIKKCGEEELKRRMER